MINKIEHNDSNLTPVRDEGSAEGIAAFTELQQKITEVTKKLNIKNTFKFNEEEFASFYDTIQANRVQWQKDAAEKNEDVIARQDSSGNKLPRAVLVKPDGKIFILLTHYKTKDDIKLAEGAETRIKFAYNLDDKEVVVAATSRASLAASMGRRLGNKGVNPEQVLQTKKGQLSKGIELAKALPESARPTFFGSGFTKKENILKYVLLTPIFEGTSLDRAENLSLQDKLDITEQLLAHMKALKDADLIHADLKPGNILFRRDAKGKIEIVLNDFTRSQSIKEPRIVPTSQTYAYAAPEISKMGEKNIENLASDLYSATLSLLEIWGYTTGIQRVNNLLSQFVPALRGSPFTIMNGVARLADGWFKPVEGDQIGELIAKGLSKDPNARPDVETMIQTFQAQKDQIKTSWNDNNSSFMNDAKFEYTLRPETEELSEKLSNLSV